MTYPINCSTTSLSVCKVPSTACQHTTVVSADCFLVLTDITTRNLVCNCSVSCCILYLCSKNYFIFSKSSRYKYFGHKIKLLIMFSLFKLLLGYCDKKILLTNGFAFSMKK